jgi:WD40 repeat protein/tRNA A-37 threonylcarbamoyl transferase component Bud32
MAVDLQDDAQAPDEVDALIATYLDARDRGQAPTKALLLAAHPAVAEELGRFLDDLDSLSPDRWPGTSPAEQPNPQDDTLVYTKTPQDDAAGAEQFQPGRVFGDYELIQLVARGGMGVVFKARQTKLDRVVALKMILAGQLASPADIQRFRTEAQAAARLDHPGIVPVYEVGECQGFQYFTMAFIEGASLAERLRDGPLVPREAARLVRDIAAAIQFAHDNGVVHRDLKPGNVLIDKHGQPKLTDFGLAKRTDQDSCATGAGQILGTPSYMAPEQTEGGGTGVGPATDVYGLGALLFALLTGRPPFQAATTLDTLLHVLSADPPRPTALNPAVPRDLETICLKCLEKPPGKRYATATALRDDLDRFLTDRPILARPVGMIERAYRWFRRRPMIGAMAVALAVLLFAVPVLLADLLTQANERVQTEVTARVTVQAAEQRRTRQLFDALVSEAAARRSSPRVGRGFRALERIGAARDLADDLKLPTEEYTRLRSEAVSAVSLLDVKASANGPGWLIRRDPEWHRYVTESDYFLAWDPPNGLLVRRVRDQHIVHRIPVDSTDWGRHQPRLSPDNRFVSSQARGKLIVWQIDGDKPVERLRRDGVGLAVFAPDRPEITIFTEANDLIAQPLTEAGEAKTVNLPKRTGEPRSPAYWKCQPGPRRLVAVPGTSSVRILDMDSGSITAAFDVPDAVQHIAWAPDGGTVAASCGVNGAIVAFDLAGKTTRHLKGNVGGPEGLAFNPSGRYLLAANVWNGRNAILNMTTGAAEMRFHCVELEPAIDPQKVLAWWQPAADDIHRIIPVQAQDAVATGGEGAIHPAGRLVATPTDRGLILNDLATGRRLGFLPAPGWCDHPRFDAAGNLYVGAGRQCVYWPVTVEGNQYRFGPWEPLSLPRGPTIDVSSDGRYVAQAVYDGSAVLDRRTGKITRMQPQPDVRHVAISPDGSLVASFGWETVGFRVWAADSGKLLEVANTDTFCGGLFTPDGKYLVVCHLPRPELELWSARDCKLVRTLGPNGSFATSPDGRYVAVGEAGGRVRITRLSDGELMARFDAPGDESIGSVTFGGNGRYVLEMNIDRTQVHVWDLWQLRHRLAGMKLDWDAEPAPEPVVPREPISVAIAQQ